MHLLQYLESSRIAHLKGKKHQRLVEEIQRRQEVARRSIFVRNFESCPGLLDKLTSFFAQHGEVVAVHLDKDKVNHVGIYHYSGHLYV